MDYIALENSIVTRLSVLELAGIDVIPLPEADNDVVNPFDRGKITVAYLSSDFDQSITSDVVAQPEKITFQIVVQSRNLRGSVGIYGMIKSVKSILMGWKTTYTDKIHFSKSAYDAHENGIWTYHVNITTENIAIEETDDVNIVLATQITMSNENESFDVVQDYEDGMLSQVVTTYDQSFKKFYKSPVWSNCIFTIPAGFQLMQAAIKSINGNGVSIKLGTTQGTNDILSGVPMDIPANTLVTNGTITTQFSTTEDQTVYLSSSNWNNASISILLICIKGL